MESKGVRSIPSPITSIQRQLELSPDYLVMNQNILQKRLWNLFCETMCEAFKNGDYTRLDDVNMLTSSLDANFFTRPSKTRKNEDLWTSFTEEEALRNSEIVAHYHHLLVNSTLRFCFYL